MFTSLIDQKWHWRCKGCGEETHLDGRGGNLNCSCDGPGDQEFKTDGGQWGDGEWHRLHNVIPQAT